ncbi:hypothetical protein T484DRAFT_1770426 [Baffinella frigidus]|nr:hypothetical protein T484DRAFT_1770426 [Cryptophyta sp. CCMP2293]
MIAVVAVFTDLFHLGASAVITDEDALRRGQWMRAGLDTQVLTYMGLLEVAAGSLVIVWIWIRSMLVNYVSQRWTLTDGVDNTWLNYACMDNWHADLAPPRSVSTSFFPLFSCLLSLWALWGTERHFRIHHVEVLKTLRCRYRSAGLLRNLAPSMCFPKFEISQV